MYKHILFRKIRPTFSNFSDIELSFNKINENEQKLQIQSKFIDKSITYVLQNLCQNIFITTE